MGSSPTSATRPVGQAVKTPPFHGGNSSSILLRVTIRNKSERFRQSKLVRFCFLLRVSKLNQKNLESNHFGRSRDSFVISVVCTQRIFRGLGIPQQVEIGSGNGYKKPKPNRLGLNATAPFVLQYMMFWLYYSHRCSH